MCHCGIFVLVKCIFCKSTKLDNKMQLVGANQGPQIFAKSNIARLLFLGRCFRTLSHTKSGQNKFYLLISLNSLICRMTIKQRAVNFLS